MGRILTFLYGLAAYFAFFGTICYTIGWVANLWVPRTIDSGAQQGVTQSVVINVLLMAAFAVQHTIMARPAFKKWWTGIVPQAAERSTFVLIASALMALILWQWRPMPGQIWNLENAAARGVVLGIYFLGWVVVFYSSFLIDHFDLFGVRQVYLHLRGKPYTSLQFEKKSLYRLVRHPLMLGFLIMAWAAPTMSTGRLLFAGLLTGYILVGTRIEERDLRRAHGEDYEAYRRSTPMLLPFPKGHAQEAGSGAPAPGATKA